MLLPSVARSPNDSDSMKAKSQECHMEEKGCWVRRKRGKQRRRRER